ncbi:uncharacterized protein XM38_017590 [Halomicronema hongdechloris C2206]|uniref:D-glucuronyl C5-epimerase C-terminal domain-containing protein n=1 Tax=Halomicronema hongdechloris C2206 TaxID=1641165 RepID=A0A1Z3HKG6_9CYAN|nr:D-glucuronyl C5-epimerase family protein [Halomicronema hongdechloris]ASC70812.1 uncharacterized protein XM38_017590 [Halomicronema hongdechloris C2206]
MTLRKLSIDISEAFWGSKKYELVSSIENSKCYPLELGFTLSNEKFYYYPKDSLGIPVKEYKTAGVQYNPTRIAAFALAHFNRHLSNGDKNSRDIFLSMADWFLKSEDGLWKYHFDWGDLKAPWISCMAQGEGISVLVRAYLLTKNAEYLDKAFQATYPFSLSVENDGVRSKIDGKWDFLEEYPSKRPSHTLNGFLYALVGIKDLINIEPDIESQIGFSELIDTLSNQWSLWDLSTWSAYDLQRSPSGRANFATVSYHKIHIALMQYLGTQLNEPQLQKCSDKWLDDYVSLPKRVRALWGKIRYRLEVPASK